MNAGPVLIALIASSLVGIMIGVVVLAVSYVFAKRSDYPALWFGIWLFGQSAVAFAGWAIFCFVSGVWIVGVFCAAFAGGFGWFAYELWKQRPRKRKEPKSNAVVRLVEGLLKVVPQ